MEKTLRWEISVPIFKNPLLLKQLGLVIGIPFGLLVLLIVITSGYSVYTLYALVLIGTLFLVAWLFIMVVYRGRYDAEFVLSEKGALCKTQTKQAQKNRIINALTVVLGLFTGKPTVAGAGMLAQAHQQDYLDWKRVRKVKYKPKSHTIILSGAWLENVVLFCTRDNYAQVEQLVRNKAGEGNG